jgi:very-short-patch-repair endonuclease
MLDSVLRKLARDQWVRLHGTPRVTVLVGGGRGREIWEQWIALSGGPGTLLEGGAGTGPGSRPEAVIDDQIRVAVARAVAEPAHPIAVLVAAEAAARWRAGRRDRLAAMADEGWTVVPEPPGGGSARSVSPDGRGAVDAGAGLDARDVGDDGPDRDRQGIADHRLGGGGGGPEHGAPEGTSGRFLLDARSVAEATLFEALEATPATAGRFRLNESLSVRFGPAAAEIDLLSRGDGIAIEIDGVHHFADPGCYRRDRRKDLLLQTHGFVVVRLLAEDVVRDVRAAVTAVSQVLAYRSRERR